MAWIIECLVCGDKFGSKQGLLEHYALAHPKPLQPLALVTDVGLACSSRRVPAVEDYNAIAWRLQELRPKLRQKPQQEGFVTDPNWPMVGPGGEDFLCWWGGTHWEMKPITARAMQVAKQLFMVPVNGWYPRTTKFSPPPNPPGSFKSPKYQRATQGFIFKEVTTK